jgi:flagellar biosynthesis chaperone FliJ
MDDKTGYSIGHLRMKYLDLANTTFTTGLLVACEGHINNFLSTVDADSEAGKKLTEELNKIPGIRKKMIDELKERAEHQDPLTKKDLEQRGMDDIEANVLLDKKEVCWRISMKMGLFYD